MVTAVNPLAPVRTKGLFNPALAGGMTYEQWNAANPTGEMPSISPPQVDDSVATGVAKLVGQDSLLNQAATTEALKLENRRGMLNSSMTTGAATDAVIKNALPIASQDSAQAYGKNQAARAFEYSMAGQDDAQDFSASQANLDRVLQTTIANWNLKSSDRNSAATMALHTEGMYADATARIMANTALSATARAAQLKSAKLLHDKQMNLTEQMYNIDLRW